MKHKAAGRGTTSRLLDGIGRAALDPHGTRGVDGQSAAALGTDPPGISFRFGATAWGSETWRNPAGTGTVSLARFRAVGGSQVKSAVCWKPGVASDERRRPGQARAGRRFAAAAPSAATGPRAACRRSRGCTRSRRHPRQYAGWLPSARCQVKVRRLLFCWFSFLTPEDEQPGEAAREG
jgi:hypothetical protein